MTTSSTTRPVWAASTKQIYEAIARRDPESARAAMRLHLTSSRERLRQAHEEAEASKVG